jgi:uncharacterized phage protein gp47/JayE
MAGLTSEGFTPLTLQEISANIEGRLNLYNPGFDFSPESPDGQLINIMGVLIAQAWGELDMVYHSFNPNSATGQALRNLGLISGVDKESASRSYAVVDVVGVEGTPIPANSLVSNSDGDEFYLVFSGVIPFSTRVISRVAGPLPVPVDSIDTVVTSVEGWVGVTQPVAGITGSIPVSDVNYRNLRNKTVMRNYTGVVETIKARLLDLGISQVSVVNNTNATETYIDGTPPLTVHTTVGEIANVTDLEIAQVIMDSMGIGVPTYGSTTMVLADSEGTPQNINFSRAVAVDVFMSINITFLDPDIGGAEQAIRNALVNEINSLLAGEDVIWSRLFGLITPYAKAQINELKIGKSFAGLSSSNITIEDGEYTNITAGSIQLTVT